MSRGAKIGLGITAAIVACIALMIVWYFNTAAGQRSLKNLKSNQAGGLERTVKVYSSDGTLIQEYEGKIDIKDTEYGNKVLFDLDGKRIVIYNATVVTEEK
ncbi:MAG: hypothetical protein E6230_20685 [Paenibacillus dendritiformis]|uniref:hypothetical protein n=1 Tax=Paenibacillus dendritiformis TaxID=130049 RepID=UPI00143DAEE4|nr:hypothetical protein [Paenibacillus dendritiformis]MDU5144590.1 hypothetical protein [Paenibacillus dendritiformis]NKI24557.1 hypothetical protein [Paenibacillus dendritiformis]NRF99605.1 hypothetical protein [Paenibacillus dendritiformis]GIO76178.1 hypothetical protein J27TS7_56920 [Paenibacillus dendritiformis]